MAIEIDTNEIVINKVTYKFLSQTILRLPMTGKLRAVIKFSAKNQNGLSLDPISITFNGDAYNTWWNGFSDGKSQYDLLKEHLGLQIEITNEVEQDFLN